MSDSWFLPAHLGDDVAVYVEGRGLQLPDDVRRELELHVRSGALRGQAAEVAVERDGQIARVRAFEIPQGTRVLLVVRPVSAPTGPSLTRRQSQVLALMEEGRTVREIAAELGLAVATARRHQVDVFKKLDSAQRGASEERARRLADRGLTAREVEIVQHVCQGRTNAEIAETLDLAAATIGPLLTRIYKTLGVKGRHELMAKVSRRHWD